MKYGIKKIISVCLTLAIILTLAIPARADESSSMQFGTLEYYSTVTDEPITDSWHYSDEWFFGSSAEKNDDLALVSMQLTAASSDGSSDGLGIQFLNKLGFTDAAYVRTDAEESAVCNYIHAKKQITNGSETFDLVAVVIQSYALDKHTKKLGWMQNFTVNTDPSYEEHGGFTDAAGQVLSEIAALSGSADTRYWIMGASRGGALASLLSIRLAEAAAAAEDHIFTYTFESPAVVNGNAASLAGSNIHNYYTSDDAVPFVPPWGMTVYGNRYDLNTAEINAQLTEELSKIGSSLSEQSKDRNPQSVIDEIDPILTVLESRISSREEYSLPHADTVSNGETEIVLEYNYQDVLVSLMDMIFSISTEGADIEGLANHLSDLYEPVLSLVSAVKTENDQDYYDAAAGILRFLSEYGLILPISETEMYGLLKLAGPALVDVDFVPEDPGSRDSAVAGYIEPLIMLVVTKDALTFSHQFETIISRLKVLAPALKLEDIAFTVEEPKAGDDPIKLKEDLQAYLSGAGMDFVSVKGSWNTGDEPLPDNTVCYFDVELTAEAHEAGEDLSVTINGAEPIRPLSIQNTGSGSTISGTWEFVIGSPSSVSVSFDAGGVKEDPETVTVAKGTKLSETLDLNDSERIEKDGRTLQCRGWKDENGTPWTSVYANNDMTLSCSWAEVISAVNISFPLPKAGESQLDLKVEEDTCYLDDIYVQDEDYEEFDVFEEGKTYILQLCIFTRDDSAVFDLVTDEDGYTEYVGKVFINGDAVYASYIPEDSKLYLSYEFTAGGEDPDPPVHTHTLESVPEKAASCTEDGNIAYYRCTECGKLFSDAEAKTEISKKDTVIKASGHEWSKWTVVKEPTTEAEGLEKRTCKKCGESETRKIDKKDPVTPDVKKIVYTVAEAPTSWTKGSSTSIKIVVKRNIDDSTCFSHFKSLTIGSSQLSSRDYTAAAGSTVLTLPSSTLNRLTVGTHTVKVVFDDGEATTRLTIRQSGTSTPTPTGSGSKSNSPNTGDGSGMMQWLSLMVAALAVLGIACAVNLRRRRKD